MNPVSPRSSPPRRRLALASALFTALAFAAPAAAQVNGGFEQVTPFNGWVLEYGTRGVGVFVPATMSMLPPLVSGVLPGGHPAPREINSTSPLVACQTPRILPYEDTEMAELNDLLGGRHATRMSQSFTITALDLLMSGVLASQVGVMLVDPGHTEAGSQPGFRAQMWVNGGNYGFLEKDATQAAADGWQQVGVCGPDPVYYKHYKFCVDVRNLKAGDVVTVALSVWDCAYGGHGGMAWCDGLKWESCTAPPSDMVGWWFESPPLTNALARDLAGPPYNDGRVVGAHPAMLPWCSKVGNALAHYSTYYVAVPDHNDLDFPASQDFSIDLWAKPATQTGIDPLASKLCWSNSGFGDGYFFFLDNGNPSLLLCSGFAFTLHKDLTVMAPANEWSHLAVTVDRSSITPTVKFYFNGDLLSGAYPAPLVGTLANGEELRLGGPPCGNSFTTIFSGCTDEIEIFRRVLTADEVLRIAANCKGKCKPCIVRPSLVAGTLGVANPAWAGHQFDVRVTAIDPISICAVSLRPYGFSGPFDVEVYTTPTGYTGKTTNAAAWTLVGTGGGTCAGGTAATAAVVECAMSTPFHLLPGDHGLAIYVRNPNGSAALAYSALAATGGNPPPWSDPDLTIVPSPATAPGVASSGRFGFSLPGLWNGALHHRPASLDAQPGFCFLGAGCPTSTGLTCRQVLLAPAVLGGVASAAITNVPPLSMAIQAIGIGDNPAMLGLLPLDLGAYGAPGCALRVSPDLTQFLPGNGGNTIPWNLAIPNVPALVGLPLQSQAFVLDPAANALGLVASDANRLLVGR